MPLFTIQKTVTLYVASSNQGKLREFAAAASATEVAMQALPGLAALPTPPEDAPDFASNADLKARAYSLAASGLLVLADDSGLEVDALGGRPGVLSARFADSMGFDADAELGKDARNNRCLLSLLHEVERAGGDRTSRGARFVCALSVARDGEVLMRTEGTLEGDIIDTPRGTNGFGYDSLFVLRNRGMTLAELSPAEKWGVSHRGLALRELLRQLPALGL